ncbi:hypothetical protein J4Q44_G00113110 [Coregonus suidteri]|uniref:Uncharacterized protein n=1 Tax=Coregonus suidteri TaxID=861788 RepID=A0AAN8QVF1_9TELE
MLERSAEDNGMEDFRRVAFRRKPRTSVESDMEPEKCSAHPSTGSSTGPSIVQLVEREGAREEGVFRATIHVQEVWPQRQCQMLFPCLSGSLALYSSFCPSLPACKPSDLPQWSALPTGQGDRMDCLASGYRRSRSLRRRISSGR